jgi:hypothetical protein
VDILTGIKPPKDKAERKQWRATMKAQAKIDAAVGIVKPKQPRPPKFPMKFKEFLRRAFGGRYHADRLHLFRKCMFEQFEFYTVMRAALGKTENNREKSAGQKVDELVVRLSQYGITDGVWGFERIYSLREWQKQNRVDQRRNAAKSRWAKEKLKKSVDSNPPSKS